MDRASSNQHSPTQTYANPYTSSERHARHRSSSYNQHSPTIPSTRYHPPPSPTTRERPTSSYYDPTSEARRDASLNNTPYPQRSPIQTRPSFDLPPQPQPQLYSNGHSSEPRTNISRPQSQSSPRVPTHVQPAVTPSGDSRVPMAYEGDGRGLMDGRVRTPMGGYENDTRTSSMAYDPIRGNGAHPRTNSIESTNTQPPLPLAPQRSDNPMSMSNILSDSTTAPPSPPKPAIPVESTPPTKPTSRKNNRAMNATQQVPKVKEEPSEPPRQPLRANRLEDHSMPDRDVLAPPAAHDGPPSLTIRDTEAAYREIEARDLSDVEIDVPDMDAAKQVWTSKTHKRALELEVKENEMRKRRRTKLIQRYQEHFTTAAEAERTIYIDKHEHEVAEEVRLKEIEEDKERKKDQQRKRRREKAIADEQQKRQEALQSLETVEDEDEKARIEREIQRHDKKIRDTQSRLQGITPSKEPRTESPHTATGLGRREREVAVAGGLMTSFYSSNTGNGNEDGTPEFTPSARGRGRGGRSGGTGRAKKSKEQKQAEKDQARLGQSMVDAGQDWPVLPPKEAERLASYADRKAREDSEPLSDAGPSMFDLQPTAGLTGMAKFDSKGYNQIYEQITRDLAKGVPKVVRIKNNSLDTKQSNARKTAQLAAKEARRWQLRTNKSTKDVAARAKRAMREMLGFWKRNERDEREGRKAAERQELDKARRAEAEREANRQKRKLNFLISQTELYSHFIRKKVKTDEIEREGTEEDMVQTSGQTTVNDLSAKHTVELPDSVANFRGKVTNFEDLDFDAEDETALQEAAMANAQNAIQEAQDRARAFNKPDGDSHDLTDAQANFDDGEMNFQNPTSLQSMDITQPKMLSCQLKEYQLKGLNWLANLYEQGINGILADEMGLGKTVQSISVMAHLAEVYNIWGPFLVIAPASTLHNWQQEITRFVPEIKVLPYWGSAKDRKVLRKFWDRKHITYNRDSPFHVLVTSYQLVVMDTAYFQKVKWQYMILDEAQAIKSSQSSRWKSLLGFHCRNRLLLTGTPIQNNMQELWALLHFIMPSLFDSHDEFSEWFSKDIENHAQSNSKLNEDQLKRLHMILKPFMLRRIKKHVQKELGDKIEIDVFCDLTYRQRAYYTNLRNKISIMDLIEKAAVGDDQDTATLMNLVMQFRKVCNHPDLFERAEVWSPMAMNHYAETASFMREGLNVNIAYSVRGAIEFWLPKMLGESPGRLDLAGPENLTAGWRNKWLRNEFSIWNGQHLLKSQSHQEGFSWLRFVDHSASSVISAARKTLIQRITDLAKEDDRLTKRQIAYEGGQEPTGFHAMLNIVNHRAWKPLASVTNEGHLQKLFNISREKMDCEGLSVIETCYYPTATAAPIELVCPSQQSLMEKERTFFNMTTRRALYPIDVPTEQALLQSKLPPSEFPVTNLLPAPESAKQRFTQIEVPSMSRFVTDSGKLARLDQLLRELKEGGHRVLLYFQMTRMIDLMEEYLTYRNYKYCRLDGSTKLEDRRDTVAAFQSSPDIFVFLLSTRAGGLGINLTSADTVIFYDSDWNPTIDSQAMDRAHRLGQTRQVTVYRLITRGTIEERIRKRALQKEEVQRVVITGQAGGTVDFNNRSHRENNRTKEMAMWLADDDQAAAIERREAEVMEEEAKTGGGKARKRKSGAPGAASKRKEVSMDDMYHEGEGKFEDVASHDPSGAATPVSAMEVGPPIKKRKGLSKKAKTVRQRLAVVDGEVG